MNSGVIFAITQDWRGDTLTVDAAAGDTVLQVKNACDFDEVFPTARYLVVGDETTPRQYIASDLETNTVTLADVVGGTGLEAGLPVVLWDPTVGTTGARTVEYVARVELHDGSGAPDVVIPHEMIPAAGVFNLVGASVTIDEDDDGDLVIGEVLGRENVSDGAYVALDDGTTMEDIYSAANAAAAAAADAAANATTALTAANGKNKVTYSLSTPGATPNTAGDIWFQKDSATQTIIGQWIGGGGTTWVSTQLRNEVIANLDAGKLVAGSAFINGLSVKTNFTLGDASTNGAIQSYNFAGSSVGVYMDKFGLVAKGGSIAGADITGSTVTATGGGSTVRLTTSSASAGGRAAIDLNAGSVDAALYATTSAAYLYCDSTLELTAPTLHLFGSSISQSATDFLGGISAPSVDTPSITGDPGFSTLTGSDGAAHYVTTGNSGKLNRGAAVSSARHLKTDVAEIDIDPETWLSLTPYKFRFRAAPDEPLQPGFMRDELEDAGLDLWLGDGDEVFYSHLSVGQQVVLRALWERLSEQAQQIATLTDRIEQLEAP